MSVHYPHSSGLHLPAKYFVGGAPPSSGDDPGSMPAQFGESKREYKAGLDAADPSNRYMRRRDGLGGSANSQLTEQRLWTVRETAYHMDYNDALPGQVTEHLTDQILGSNENGFRLEPNTGDATLNGELQAAFREWSNDPSQVDVRGERDLHGLSWQNLFSCIMGGDGFGLLLDDGLIQLLEPTQCVSPTFNDPIAGEVETQYAGIKLGHGNAPEGYWFSAVVPAGPYVDEAHLDYRPRYDEHGVQVVTHTYSAHRSSQNRGYTWWLPVMVACGMLDDLDFAMVLKAQASAAIAGVAEDNGKGATGGEVNFGKREIRTDANGDQTTFTKLKFGGIVTMPKGKILKDFAPSVPNAEHMSHITYQLKKVGAAMHAPYILLLLDASQTNFSGWRGAMDTARETWRRIQRMLICQWYGPVYRWWLARRYRRFGATARRLARSGVLWRHRWIPRAWRYIQPAEDSKADATILKHRLNSPRGLLAERGLDIDDVRRETVEDNTAFILSCLKAAQRLNRLVPGAGVTWRDVAYLASDQANTATAQAAIQNEALTDGES